MTMCLAANPSLSLQRLYMYPTFDETIMPFHSFISGMNLTTGWKFWHCFPHFAFGLDDLKGK